jgi:hypothetical protein
VNHRFILTPLLFFVLSSAAHAGVLAIFAIELTAEKTTIRSDGRSTTVITARVLNERGGPVDDGTRVRFVTTLGRLDSEAVETRNGIARVTLIASDQPGTATVTANLEAGQAVPARANIVFTSDLIAVESGDRWIRISGTAYTVYATGVPEPSARLIEAVGGGKHDVRVQHDARVQFRDIEITADHLQHRVGSSEVFAEGEAVLKVGGVTRTYFRLRYDLQQRSGIGERASGLFLIKNGAAEIATENRSDNSALMAAWKFADLSQAQQTITATAIAIDPTGALQFRRAAFYVDGQRILALPFHLMAPGQQTFYREQLIGVGPSGLTLNLPYYYDVRPSGVGLIHLRRGAQFGSSVYSYRAGWGLDIDQTYNARGGVTGLFQVLNITRPERSLRLQHGQKLTSKTDASVFIDLPGGKSLFASSQLNHAFPTFRLGWLGNVSRYAATVAEGTVFRTTVLADLRNQLFAESYPKPTTPKSHLRYTLNLAAAEQRFSGIVRPSIRTQNLGTRLSYDPIALGKTLTLTQSALLAYTRVQAQPESGAGQSGASVQGTTQLSQPVTARGGESLGSVQLTYDYSQTPLLFTQSGPNASLFTTARHRLGVTSFLSKQDRWNASLTGSRGLDVNQSSVFGELRTTILGPYWGRVRRSQTVSSGIAFQDTEYALGRSFQGREISLYYSTTTRRFLLDLTSFGL